MRGVSWTDRKGDDISTVLVPSLGELPPGGTIHVADCNGYQVSADVELERGRYRCRELLVSQGESGEPVTGEALRAIPLAQLIRAGLNHVERLAALMGRAERPPVTTRGGPTPEVLAWLAHQYRRAYAVGDPPKQAVAQGLGVSIATAGRWISRAREAGLLDAVEGPGKAGG